MLGMIISAFKWVLEKVFALILFVITLVGIFFLAVWLLGIGFNKAADHLEDYVRELNDMPIEDTEQYESDMVIEFD